jgi:hypothetical protein
MYYPPAKDRSGFFPSLARIADYQGFDPGGDLSPDGSTLVIVDHGQAKGEIRILNLADRTVTVLPVRGRGLARWEAFTASTVATVWQKEPKELGGVLLKSNTVQIIVVP